MKYLPIVTNILGGKTFMYVQIFDENNKGVGSASVILKEGYDGLNNKYFHKMTFCDIVIPDVYMEKVSKKAIESRCNDVRVAYAKK